MDYYVVLCHFEEKVVFVCCLFKKSGTLRNRYVRKDYQEVI